LEPTTFEPRTSDLIGLFEEVSVVSEIVQQVSLSLLSREVIDVEELSLQDSDELLQSEDELVKVFGSHELDEELEELDELDEWHPQVSLLLDEPHPHELEELEGEHEVEELDEEHELEEELLHPHDSLLLKEL